MEPHPATMEPHPAPTEHRPATMVPHRSVAATVAEAMAVVSATDFRRPTVHRREEAAVVDLCPRLMEHLVLEAMDCPPATVPLPEVAVADSQDHLRLTVHLAPVVAVSMEAAADVDILEAEVVTLTAAAGEAEVTRAAVDTPTVAAADILTVAAAADTQEVVATLEVAEVVTLEVAVVDTLEAEAAILEAEAATLEAEVATLEAAEVVTLEVAEVVRATLATEVTNINRNLSSPRANTFDPVSSVIEHHRPNQSNPNASMSSMLQSKRDNLIQRTKIYRSNGTTSALTEEGMKRNR